MGRTKENNMLKKKERKRQKQKKHEGGATEVSNGCIMHSTVEDHAEMRKKDKNKKKKKKKRKHEGSTSEESSHCSDAVYSIVEGGTGMRKEGKKKKKKKMKTMNKEDVVYSDLGFNTILNEAVNVMDNVEVVNSTKENDQKMSKSEFKRDRKEHENGLKKHGRVGGKGVDVEEYSDDRFHDGREKKRRVQLKEEKDVGTNFRLEVRNHEKRSHGDNIEKDVTVSISPSMEISTKNKKGKDKVLMGQKLNEAEDITEVKDMEEGSRTKKIKKRRDYGHSNVEGKNNSVNTEDTGKERVQPNKNIMEKVKHRKKDKMGRKRKDNYGLESELRQIVAVNTGDKSILNGNGEFVGGTRSTKTKNRAREIEACIVGTEDENKRKRNKVKLAKNISSEEPDSEAVSTTKENVESSNLFEKSKPDLTPKRVRFSDHAEVFPSLNGQEGLVQGSDSQEGLVQGKRFSREGDEMMKEAVWKYIEDHDLGNEGLNKVMNCGANREVRGCWKKIASTLPWRARESVYHRALILFEKDEKRAWSTNVCEVIRRFHEQHGSDWTVLANICKWAHSDDYRLVNALFNLDVCCMEDVDWDSLIEHRSGDLCRKRWNQMIRHIGEYKNKSFAEKVELLSKRYLPDMIEARQANEDKVAVD